VQKTVVINFLWSYCVLCRPRRQRSGRPKMEEIWSSTLRTSCEHASCATFTTAATWSTWHKMNGLTCCWHSNTLLRSTFANVHYFQLFPVCTDFI